MRSASIPHGLIRVRGRDPHEAHRTATALELLFDLVFVIAFGMAADELAHAQAAGHLAAGIGGFAFVCFGIFWAWLQWTFYSSAFDTDDWLQRLLTMVTMVGLIIFTLGIGPLFASVDHGEHLDNRVLVVGYVVMRVPQLVMWMRVLRHDPVRARAARFYLVSIAVAQLLWCWIAFANLALAAALVASAVPMAIELVGPMLAERGAAGPESTPWHAHHIAERYGLIVIIALGEGLLGTASALEAIVGPEGPGWSWDVALLGLAGVAMILGMWWSYFGTRWGDFLHRHRERGFWFGYGHYAILVFLVSVGAGLHVAAYFYEHHSALHEFGTTLAVALPLGGYLLALYVLFGLLSYSADPYHLGLLAGTAAVVGCGVALAALGAPLSVTLLVLAAAPWVTVVGIERHGDDFQRQLLASG